MKNRVLFIYWARFDFAIVQNIKYTFERSNKVVTDHCVEHLQHRPLGRKLGVKSNSSFANYCYLFWKILYLNLLSITFKNVYVLGPKSYLFSFFRILFWNSNLVFHYNELPSFIEGGSNRILVNFEYWICKNIKHVVVSNPYRKQLFEKLGISNQAYYVLDNILKIEEYDDSQNYNVFDSKNIRLLYVGIIHANRQIKQIIEWVSKSKGYELYLAGFMAKNKENAVLQKIIETHSDRIYYLGNLQHEAVFDLIRTKCDLGLAFYNQESLNNKFCAPLKIHEYFHLYKLVISFKNPPLTDIERKYGIIYTVSSLAEIFREETIANIRKRIQSLNKNKFDTFKLDAIDDFQFEISKILKVYES